MFRIIQFVCLQLTGEYPRPVDPEFFNLLDAVEGSEESSRPRDSSHTSSGQREVRDKEQRENSPAIPRYMNFYAERSADGRSPTPTQVCFTLSK